MRTRRRIRSAALLLSVLASCLGATSAVVTAANLLDHEMLWPYRVTLTESWQPVGRDAPVSSGTDGVLIRVEPGQLARIDFAREGKHEVPVGKTDLVDNANRIARGELEKPAPNFIYAMAMKLVDPASDPPAPLGPQQLADRHRFLCVFADVSTKGFTEIAGALRPLTQRSDLWILLFPQGRTSNAEVVKRLRASDWIVPFAFEHLSEPYTKTLLRDGTPMPSVMLVTNEGRVLYQDVWQPGAIAKLVSALDTGSSNP